MYGWESTVTTKYFTMFPLHLTNNISLCKQTGPCWLLVLMESGNFYITLSYTASSPFLEFGLVYAMAATATATNTNKQEGKKYCCVHSPIVIYQYSSGWLNGMQFHKFIFTTTALSKRISLLIHSGILVGLELILFATGITLVLHHEFISTGLWIESRTWNLNSFPLLLYFIGFGVRNWVKWKLLVWWRTPPLAREKVHPETHK